MSSFAFITKLCQNCAFQQFTKKSAPINKAASRKRDTRHKATRKRFLHHKYSTIKKAINEIPKQNELLLSKGKSMQFYV